MEKAAIGNAKGTRGQFAGAKPGKRRGKGGGAGNLTGGAVAVPPAKDVPTNAELGLSKRQAARSAKLAAMPESEREAIVALARLSARRRPALSRRLDTAPPAQASRSQEASGYSAKLHPRHAGYERTA